MPESDKHYVNDRQMFSDAPDGYQIITLGMGCFWGAERLFWQTDGVWVTAVGYAGGRVDHPDYRQVCTGTTGHAEVVKVVYNPEEISTQALLAIFWEEHDPTQGMRQGNDIGTQYRSVIYCSDAEQLAVARASKAVYEQALKQQGLGEITTEIKELDTFYPAEEYHQQYLAKNPGGYCGLKGTGVSCVV